MQKGSIHGDMAFVFKICDCNHVKVGRVVRDIGEIRIYQGGASCEIEFQEVVSNSATEGEPLGTDRRYRHPNPQIYPTGKSWRDQGNGYPYRNWRDRLNDKHKRKYLCRQSGSARSWFMEQSRKKNPCKISQIKGVYSIQAQPHHRKRFWSPAIVPMYRGVG